METMLRLAAALICFGLFILGIAPPIDPFDIALVFIVLGVAVFILWLLVSLVRSCTGHAIAVIEAGRCTLYSRNGNPCGSFADLATKIGNALMPRSAVMDGEIVCLDKLGHCRFNDLLFHRGDPYFVAFDLLHNGRDLRRERLIDRKHELRRIIGNGIPPILYADYIAASGIGLFEKVCKLDLEGIVAKQQYAPYDPQQTTWFKIKNRGYSQMVGREKLFERERHQEPVAGWHACALAAAQS